MQPKVFMATGDTANIDVSSSSQKVQVSTAYGAHDVRVVNDGTATVWIKFGVTTGLTAATTTSKPVRAGSVEILRVPPLGAATFVAAIAAGSTGKIYFTPGFGV